MPRARGEPISKARENLTEFGAVFYEICKYLEVSPAEVAILSGFSEALISKNTRVIDGAQTYPPTRKTVVRIYNTFEQIALQKNLLLIPEIKVAFFNAHPALYATDDQAERASRIVEQLQDILKQARRGMIADPSPDDNEEKYR